MSDRSVGNPKIRNQRNNQPVKDNGLIAKAIRTRWRVNCRGGVTKAGGEAPVRRRIQMTAPWHEMPKKRKLLLFVFFDIRAPCKRKEAGTMPSSTKGAASPWFTGEGSRTC